MGKQKRTNRMLSLVLVALIAAMAAGAEIPLDMAAAAHPAVKSAVSLGGAGGVPIVSGAAIGANYNQAVCPSGIGCGVGGMWKSRTCPNPKPRWMSTMLTTTCPPCL